MRWLIYFMIGFVVAFALVGSFNDSVVEEEIVVPEISDPLFRDITSEVSIDYRQSNRGYLIDDQAYLRGDLQGLFSGGADYSDYDNDGDLDLFVSRLDDGDILYRNDDGKFVDVSSDVGLSDLINGNKAKFVDYNNDGYEDLVVSVIGQERNFLYRNDKGSFKEEAVDIGFALGTSFDRPIQYGFGIAVGDYNNDGWMDIMTSNWDRMTIREGKKDEYGRLYENDGDGKFEDVTEEAGVRMVTSEGYGDVSFDSEFADIDNDGDLDLLVAADFGNSRLYINEEGKFVDRTNEWNFGLDEFGMGITTGDYDNDGLIDVFVTSIYCQDDDCMDGMSGNKLYHNMDGYFEEVAENVGVADGGWGWETEFFDYDLDGDLDLIMVLGMKEKIMGEHDFSSDAVRLWRNDGERFVDVTADLGLDVKGEGRDVVVFDYDNDGDEDIFVVRNGENGVLFENLIISTPSS